MAQLINENLKMEGFCKGCLTKHDDSSLLLQYTEKNRRLYVYATGLQVKRNDPLPFQLCKACYMNMKQTCKFKKQCRTSDKLYKNYLALKEAGDTTDFCTYLKNNDDSLMFPMVNVNTSSSQKAKDDDNESTCTSIRNFMSNLLQPDEIPDTEARIIREVIEEEADVLEDSLDSHWLQDDVSIDTDFHLDFNFSPFSTPRSGHNERFQTPESVHREPYKTPQKNDDQNQESGQVFDQESFIAAKKILLKSTSDSDKPAFDISVTINKDFPENIGKENLESQDTIPSFEEFLQENNEGKQIEINEIEYKRDNINLNLEEALKNTENTEFSLDALLATPKSDVRLATPQLQPGASGFSTPTIQNIIFGTPGKIESMEKNSNREIKEKYDTENFQNEVSETGTDILDEFFNKETGEYIGDANKKEEIEIFEEYQALKIDPLEKPVKSKYDLSDFSCKLCDKRFSGETALKIHFSKIHKFKIPGSKGLAGEVICDHCGMTYNCKQNLQCHIINKHIQKSKTSLEVYKCKKCSLEFRTKWNLSKHVRAHNKTGPQKPKKKYVCTFCGHQTSYASNLKTHMRRHTKEYLYNCSDCGRGYYRKFDLDQHMRTHNGDRPFLCSLCPQVFNRPDVLKAHIKLRHTNERPFVCTDCRAAYKTALALRRHKENCLRKMRITGEELTDDKGDKYFVLERIIPGKEKGKSGKRISQSGKCISPVAEDIEMTDLLDMDCEEPLDCDSVDLPDIDEDGTVNLSMNAEINGDILAIS